MPGTWRETGNILNRQLQPVWLLRVDESHRTHPVVARNRVAGDHPAAVVAHHREAADPQQIDHSSHVLDLLVDRDGRGGAHSIPSEPDIQPELTEAHETCWCRSSRRCTVATRWSRTVAMLLATTLPRVGAMTMNPLHHDEVSAMRWLANSLAWEARLDALRAGQTRVRSIAVDHDEQAVPSRWRPEVTEPAHRVDRIA